MNTEFNKFQYPLLRSDKNIKNVKKSNFFSINLQITDYLSIFFLGGWYLLQKVRAVRDVNLRRYFTGLIFMA